MAQLVFPSVNLGGDPEFFFEKDGEIIGSEKVIPEKGLTAMVAEFVNYSGGGAGKFVRDGVQVEVHPVPHQDCRANFGNELRGCFKFLNKWLQQPKFKGISLNLSPLVDVSSSEMDSLSDLSKILGCMPSENLYDHGLTPGVDGQTYLKRSAGGHIHLGFKDNFQNPGLKDLPHIHERIISLMDILVGNTCVLIDRHPGNIERRRVYGRAGEFRRPPHGVEYRTLSNFWLTAYPLVGMVYGLAKIAMAVINTSEFGKQTYDYTNRCYVKNDPIDVEGELLKMVDQQRIIRAINENDLSIARENWKAVREFFTIHACHANGIWTGYLEDFDFFAKMVAEEGLSYWFPDETLSHWNKMGDGHYCGFETLLTQKVRAAKMHDRLIGMTATAVAS